MPFCTNRGPIKHPVAPHMFLSHPNQLKPCPSHLYRRFGSCRGPHPFPVATRASRSLSARAKPLATFAVSFSPSRYFPFKKRCSERRSRGAPASFRSPAMETTVPELGTSRPPPAAPWRRCGPSDLRSSAENQRYLFRTYFAKETLENSNI